MRDGSTLYLVKRLGICRCLACRNSRSGSGHTRGASRGGASGPFRYPVGACRGYRETGKGVQKVLFRINTIVQHNPHFLSSGWDYVFFNASHLVIDLLLM